MSHTPPFKTKVAAVKLTPEQYREIEQRAERCGVRLSAWMRSILLQAASQKSRKGYLHIREPDGATT
jgi:hypothetical protein